jgi:aconitate hydratase
MNNSNNSFNTLGTLSVGDKQFTYFAINGGELASYKEIARLPVTIKILLENMLRNEDGLSCSRDDVKALVASGGNSSEHEIAYHPARVIMQDFTGVPAVVD